MHTGGESGQQFIALPLSLMQGSGGGGGGDATAAMATVKHNLRAANGASTSGDSIMKDVNVKTELNND